MSHAPTPLRLAGLLAGLGLCALALAGCREAAAEKGDAVMSLTLISPAFEPGGEIPQRYTCEGEDISPPLEIAGVPAETRSLALVVDDPDVPDPDNPRRTWVHWVLYDIPPDVRILEEGLDELPEGAREGLNDWKSDGYGGPCPPIGRHRYFHKLYALDTQLGDLGTPTKAELLEAMEGHVLLKTHLVGTYIKKDEAPDPVRPGGVSP